MNSQVKNLVWTNCEKIDCASTNVHGNKYACHLCIENLPKNENQNYIVVKQDNSSLKILKILTQEKQKSNSVSFCSCDTFSQKVRNELQNLSSSVMATFISREALLDLEQLSFRCFVDEETLESEEKCFRILESVQKLIEAEESIPCIEGEILMLTDDEYILTVHTAEPSNTGLWTSQTDVNVEFLHQPPKLESIFASESDLAALRSVIQFSGTLIKSHLKRSDSFASVMSQNVRKFKQKMFNYQWREIPANLVSILLKENGRKNIFPSGSVVVNSESCGSGTYLKIASFSGISSILSVVKSPWVEKGFVYACSSLLDSVQKATRQYSRDDLFSDKIKIESAMTNVKRIKVIHLELSLFNCQLLCELSPQDVDCILQEFFRLEKIFPAFTDPNGMRNIGTIFEINIFENLTPTTEHLRWSLKSRNSSESLFFRVDSLKTETSIDNFSNDNFAFVVSRRFTNLLLASRYIYHPLPCETKSHSSGHLLSGFKIFENLPPQLVLEREQLLCLLTTYINAEKVSGRPMVLCFGPHGSGKSDIFRSLSLKSGLPLVSYDCGLMLGDSSGATEAKLKRVFAQTRDESPCILLLRNVDFLAKNRDGERDERLLSSLQEELDMLTEVIKDGATVGKHKLIFVICETNLSPTSGAFDEKLAAMFEHQMVLPSVEIASEKDTRRETLNWLVHNVHGRSLANEGSFLDSICQKTSGFLYGDLCALVEKSIFHSNETLLEKYQSIKVNQLVAPLKLTVEDFERSLKHFDQMMAGAIGAPKIPEIHWEDVGGLESTKKEILETIQLPLLHPDLMAGGLKRSGILMYGPPGVGKTLLAKAVATECSLNFLSVKGPELLNMYVGQSESNVRDVFRRARQASPCVIFFDELDSLAPNRGKTGDSGGVMDRVVSQLLAEMDGLVGGDNQSNGSSSTSSKDRPIFVIGATNRPDLIDPALLRPGRFDRLVYIGISSDAEEKVRILEAQTRKFNLVQEKGEAISNLEDRRRFLFEIQNILSERGLHSLTGADYYALCSDAMLSAISRTIENIESKIIERESAKILVSKNDFEISAQNLMPSVSKEDLMYYENLNSKNS